MSWKQKDGTTKRALFRKLYNMLAAIRLKVNVSLIKKTVVSLGLFLTATAACCDVGARKKEVMSFSHAKWRGTRQVTLTAVRILVKVELRNIYTIYLLQHQFQLTVRVGITTLDVGNLGSPRPDPHIQAWYPFSGAFVAPIPF